LCVSDHDIFLSEFILAECEEKFREKIKLPSKEIQDVFTYLKDNSEIVDPVQIPLSSCGDRNDIPVLGTAVTAQATILVTCDKKRLSLKKFRKVKIIPPRELWTGLGGL